jgi:hypothetical protein
VSPVQQQQQSTATIRTRKVYYRAEPDGFVEGGTVLTCAAPEEPPVVAVISGPGEPFVDRMGREWWQVPRGNRPNEWLYYPLAEVIDFARQGQRGFSLVGADSPTAAYRDSCVICGLPTIDGDGQTLECGCLDFDL